MPADIPVDHSAAASLRPSVRCSMLPSPVSSPHASAARRLSCTPSSRLSTPVAPRRAPVARPPRPAPHTPPGAGRAQALPRPVGQALERERAHRFQHPKRPAAPPAPRPDWAMLHQRLHAVQHVRVYDRRRSRTLLRQLERPAAGEDAQPRGTAAALRRRAGRSSRRSWRAWFVGAAGRSRAPPVSSGSRRRPPTRRRSAAKQRRPAPRPAPAPAAAHPAGDADGRDIRLRCPWSSAKLGRAACARATNSWTAGACPISTGRPAEGAGRLSGARGTRARQRGAKATRLARTVWRAGRRAADRQAAARRPTTCSTLSNTSSCRWTQEATQTLPGRVEPGARSGRRRAARAPGRQRARPAPDR